MPTVYQVGNTVRLDATFNDFNSSPVDPDAGTARLTIYGATLDDELMSIPEDGLTRDGVGQFHYYLVLTTTGDVTYEWFAVIGGNPTLVRRTITVAEV